MRLTIERDGKRETVDVAPDLASVTLGGRTFPLQVVSHSATRVELEIAGEKIVVDHWPEHFPQPPGPVDVGGERWNVSIGAEPGPSAAPARSDAEPPARASAGAAAPPPAGEGIAILPPMPGKVLEVRVREGDVVRKGDVLLRLEAMKMSNEIASPADGTVHDVRVAAGANVRAREPMLFVRPAR